MENDTAGQAPFRMGGMPEKTFKRLSEFIHTEVGIKLPSSKKTMLEARLQKRLRLLGMRSFQEYCEFLFTPGGMESELHQLIDVVTTNTTDFFREPKHFEYLTNTILPGWRKRHGSNRPLNLWSAGCSIGMEPYTLTMVLEEFARANPPFSYSILATDISTQALETAAKGIYEEERVAPVPALLKKKYLLRSKDKSKRLVRVVPELRQRVAFRRLNFMEEFSFKENMDIIFCRNVIIYFDRATQEVLFNKFCRHLLPGGFLFIGHSESLTGMDLPLRQIAPTVYLR